MRFPLVNPETHPCARAFVAAARLRRAGRRAIVAAALFAAGAATLRAHRPNESTAVFRWEHGRLEAQATFPLPMATALLGDPAVPAIRADNFPAVRAALAGRLTAAFAVEIAGNPVRPETVVVELSPEQEVVATFLFPPAEPAALRLHARFLERASSDAFCLLRVWFGADRLLGTHLLVRPEPATSVAAPPPDAP